MRQNIWCLLFLIVCLAAVLVKSQSFSEVDEDGNEIEVKRFYIEGRQLNGGRRQCVETRRRKRAYNYGQSDNNANDELPIASGTAATGIDTAVSLDEEDAAKEEEEAIDNENNTNEEQIMAEHKEEQMEQDEADDERKEEAVLSLPVIAQITHSNGEQSSVGAAAAAAGDNGIVIVHTNKPPKVNPQTHAVFELRPVQSDVNDNIDNDEYYEDEGDDEDNSNFIYHEEISPVSTTAIWSTGEDNLSNLYDDYKNDEEDNEDGDEAAVKPKPKPKPPKKKPSKRPTKRPSKKPSKNKNKKNKNKKNKNKNKKPSHNKHRRPGNKNKHMPGKRGMGNNKRRRPNNGQYNSRRGQLNNLHAHNQGTGTFTKTATFTRTGTGDEDRDVNCIIINKTTTPRPFWGLLGRSADGEVVAPADRPYGRRKRINFSIPA